MNSRHCSMAALSICWHARWRTLLLIVCLSFSPLVSAQMINYNGGRTMQGPIKVFLIFWEPTGLTYDSSTSTSDANFKTIIGSFISNLTPSPYFNILTQYYGTCESNSSNSCVISNSAGMVTLGGSFTDPNPYPNGRGSMANPLQDSDIRNEVQRAIGINSWPVGMDSEFFVFTTSGIQECSSFGCTFFSSQGPVFCGYHDSFGGPTIYAFIEDPGCGTPGPAPNLASADDAIVTVSHELFESITDPLVGSAWGGVSEIGDGCGGSLGPRAATGSNVVLNGNSFVVQQIFSNDSLLCVLSFGPSVQLTAATGDDDLRGDSSVTATLSNGTGTPFQGVLFKSLTQSTWGDRTSQVRVFGIQQTQLSSIGLALSPGGLGNNDEWKLQALDVKIFAPNGTLLCDQNITDTPADLKGTTLTAFFATPNCAPFTVTTAWDSIEIEIRTGTDDATHDSEVTATIAGQTAPICLKPSTSSNLRPDPICTRNASRATDQQGHNSWDNFTNSVQTFALNPTQTLASGFSTMTINLTNADSHCDDFGHEGCDNWDIEGVKVTVFNSQGPTPARTTLLNVGNLTGGSGDDCLARLKSPHHSNATAVTFGLDGSSSSVYANGREMGTPTGCKNNGD